MRDCPHYQGDTVSQMMVVAAYLPLMTWAFAAIIAAYDRTPFHVLLTSGLFLSDWTGLLLRLALPASNGPSVTDANMCASALLRQRPCHEATIVWYVFIYYLEYDLRLLHHHIRYHRVLCVSVPKIAFKFVILLIYCVMTCWSQVHLRLFKPTEVAIASVAGMGVALCVNQVLYLILPTRPAWKTSMTYWCCLAGETEGALLFQTSSSENSSKNSLPSPLEIKESIHAVIFPCT